jgi:hypothetical protein
MSWDLFVQNLPEGVHSVDDIPDDFEPPVIGKRSEIIRRILEVVPTADFTDPAWGKIDGDDFSIEVNLVDEEDVQSFAFHIHGGDLAAFVASDLLQHLGCRALDPNSDTGIFEPDPDATQGLQRWRAYRDKILKG